MAARLTVDAASEHAGHLWKCEHGRLRHCPPEISDNQRVHNGSELMVMLGRWKSVRSRSRCSRKEGLTQKICSFKTRRVENFKLWCGGRGEREAFNVAAPPSWRATRVA